MSGPAATAAQQLRRPELEVGGTAANAGALKILFLLPFAPDLRGSHGGARAIAAIVDMLSKQHRVQLLYLAEPGIPAPRQLPGGCERLIAVPSEPFRSSPATALGRVLDRLAELAWRAPKWVTGAWSPEMARRAAEVAAEFDPDIVHFEFHVMAQYIPAVGAAVPGAARIVTEHEPGITADARAGVALTLRQRLGVIARRQAWRRYERRALLGADAIIVFTDADAAALADLLGRASPPLSVIPLRLPSDEPVAANTTVPVPSDFLFVGNFKHPPNADAARRLVQEILPRIRRAMPGATLTIVGANPPEDVVAAASDGLIVTGWVDDPAVYLAGASVVLVPLRQGGGLRVKMLEACASGKPIVASRTAIEGLSLIDGEHVILAETDREFADAAVAMMRDSERRARLAEASRIWAQQANDDGQWSAQYAQLHANIIDGRGSRSR